MNSRPPYSHGPSSYDVGFTVERAAPRPPSTRGALRRPVPAGRLPANDLAGRVRALLLAARARDELADLLDDVADQQERDLDLACMLSPVSRREYGADWPARRRAVLDRTRARGDRLRAREDLIAVLELCGGSLPDDG